MIVGIDASNIKSGGGLNHILGILKFYKNENKKITKIIIWCSFDLKQKIPNNKIIIKKTNIFLNQNLLLRFFWQLFLLPYELYKNNCELLFQPGSTFTLTKVKKISMCQNLLPFYNSELKKFGLRLFLLKILFLRIFQSLSFYKADGIIFLSKHSIEVISKIINLKKKKIIIIEHGVEEDFYFLPKKQKHIEKYSKNKPFKLLYVSSLLPYKNHENILRVVSNLRKKNFFLEIHIVGSVYKPYFRKIKRIATELDPNDRFIFFHGEKSKNAILKFYQNLDGFIFSSSCESFGQIISEAMMSGMPIICSNKSSMKEILQKDSFYFDPMNIVNIQKNLIKYLKAPDEREKFSLNCQKKVKKFTWEKCSKKTFSFISDIGSI